MGANMQTAASLAKRFNMRELAPLMGLNPLDRRIVGEAKGFKESVATNHERMALRDGELSGNRSGRATVQWACWSCDVPANALGRAVTNMPDRIFLNINVFKYDQQKAWSNQANPARPRFPNLGVCQTALVTPR
ncbi:hypothetical protein H7J87_34965 [Mycolicibacterium wolinskyi]|uniref:hypothetical protein n=1 Tax=Mycolicibacterium TaxID=1866885 RepID=UPI0013FD651D|nr:MULTISPECIES: hypothetical protein [Mycolicibacterium]MCV7290540.1 hypothetical protein [Mycolicibacterium wolinskyi]MCV7291590.1 hypothetical protein [Mycolicibacterium goodii]